jgi:hypothetical protein
MSFSTQVGGFSQKTVQKLQKVRKAIIIKLFNAVILDTPVLSGRLRGNWRVSEENPDYLVDDTVDPNGDATMQAVDSVVNNSKGGKPVFLTNSLPYAARIEYDGWSNTKAPEGMVRKNVSRFQQIVQAENVD